MFFGGGDPFEHFAHGGGGGSSRSRRPAADVDTTKLYETLGVSKLSLKNTKLRPILCAYEPHHSISVSSLLLLL